MHKRPTRCGLAVRLAAAELKCANKVDQVHDDEPDEAEQEQNAKTPARAKFGSGDPRPWPTRKAAV
jgi:hypothetical protein